jgi:RHS repeat-associated protein
MTTRNVTNTAFTSYPATGIELPNGRQLTQTYDLLYRRTLVHDATNGVDVAAWQFFGPSRTAELTLGNGLICTWMNNARTNSSVQPGVPNPAWGDQSSDRLGYDGAGRPITKRYLAGGLNGSNGYANPSAVVGFTTEYDLASNKFYERALHAEERSHLYEPFSNGSPTGGYDSLNRLRQYKRGTLTSDDGFAGNGGGSVATAIALPNTDTQRTYDLDSLGNWRRTVSYPVGGLQQAEVRQHNGLNEITRIQTNGGTPTPFSYDGVPGASNGNLANDGTRSYVWDALNRLMQANRVSDGAVIGQYVYDALNRRIRRTVPDLGDGLGGLTGDIPAGTTDCIYSGWRCIEERNPFGESGDTPTIQYIWGIYLDELLQQFNIVALNGFSANVALYPMQDLLYRTTGLADSAGTVREAYDTDAYGNTLIFRNGSAPGPITWIDSGEGADTPVDYPTCTFIFTGQRFDPETQTYYYKERCYVPVWGRFISCDPAPFLAGGLNPYLYVAGMVPAALDPSGRSWLSSVASWVGNEVSSGANWVGDQVAGGANWVMTGTANPSEEMLSAARTAYVQNLYGLPGSNASLGNLVSPETQRRPKRLFVTQWPQPIGRSIPASGFITSRSLTASSGSARSRTSTSISLIRSRFRSVDLWRTFGGRLLLRLARQRCPPCSPLPGFLLKKYGLRSSSRHGATRLRRALTMSQCSSLAIPRWLTLRR